MTDNNSTDLLEIDTNVQPLDWGSTSTQVDSDDNNTSEKSNTTNSEDELLSVDPDVPALDWTSYNPEVLKYLDQEPTEDSWYDIPGGLFRGVQDQLHNTANAVWNPVDQFWDALTGGEVDIASIRTSGDRYQGWAPQLAHQFGEAVAQFGTSVLGAGIGSIIGAGKGAVVGSAGGAPGAAGGALIGGGAGATVGGIMAGAASMAGQGLEKYKASYIEALQSGLSEEAARKEATLKTWDSLPANVLEQLIPYGLGKIPGLDKLVTKGAIKLLPNGAVKVLDKPLAKAIMSGGAHEFVQEAAEEGLDIGIEQYVGERNPITEKEMITRPLVAGAQGAVLGAGIGGLGHAVGTNKQAETINRTKKGYDKFIDSAVQKAIDKQTSQPETTTQQEEQVQPETTTQQEEQVQPETTTQQEEQVQPETTTQQEEQVQPEATTQQEEQVQPETTTQQEQPTNEEQYYRENIKPKEVRAIDNDDGTKTYYKRTKTIIPVRPIKSIEELAYDDNGNQYVKGKVKLEDALNNKSSSTNYKITYADKDKHKTVEYKDGAFLQYKYKLSSEKEFNNYNSKSTVPSVLKTGTNVNPSQESVQTSEEPTVENTTYTPITEEETNKNLDALETSQKDWFTKNEVLDSKGNKISYDKINDNDTYTYIDEKGKKKTALGVELLNTASGETFATTQPKGFVIKDNKTNQTVPLSKVPLGSKKTFTVTIDGNVANDKADAKTVRYMAGMHKRMQISSRKNPNGTTTTIITTPADTKIKGAEANLTQTITDGTSTTTITENPVTVSNTKPDTIDREEAVQKQKSQTRKKAIKKQKTGLTDAAIVNQSLVSGSANQSTFAQIMETNSDQFTKTGKPDTIPTEADEARRVMDIDLYEQDYAIQQQADSVGISSDKLTTLDEVNKLGKKVPPQLIKNKIRYLVNKLAGIADTVILDKLQQKGIAGQHSTEDTLGMTNTKLGYGRVRKAMDYISALHELAHNIWQSGSDLDSKGTKVHPDIIGIKSLANSKGIKLRDLYKELNKAWNIINSKVALTEYNSRKVPEEQFCETFAKYTTDHDMAKKIKQAAPTLASLMDEQIDSMPEAREVVSQLRDLTTAYNNLSSKDKLLANMELVPKEPTKLQKARNWFTQEGKDWWFSRLWTRFIDTTHFTRRAAKYLAKKNPTVKDKLESLSDAVEYIQATESFDAKEFLSGRGITADGTYLGRQFKSIAEMTSNIVDVAIANLPVNQRTDAKAIKAKVKEMNNNFLAYLYALDTVGSYTGNKKVMENVRKLVQDTNMSLVDTHKILSIISDNFWGVFTKEGTITKSDFTPEQLKLLNNDSKLIDKMVKVMNSIKSKINVPSESELVKIASNNRSYEHTLKDDGTVDLDAARATWLYENYKLPNAKDVAETGADLLDALNVVVETESDPLAHVYKQLAEDYYTYQDSLLEYVKNYSIGGGAWVDSVRENGHAYYVPLLRMFENNEEQTDYPEVNSRLYKMYHREGSTRPVRNIWESTIKQTNSLVYGAHQSRIKEAFVEMANTVGGGKFIRERLESDIQVSLNTTSLISQIKEELENKRQELTDRGMDVSELTDDSIDALAESLAKANITSFNLFVPDTQFKKLQDARIFTVWDSKTNRLRYYEVDKSVWLSFNKQVTDPNSWFGKLTMPLKVFTQIMRLGLIDYNPAFNLIVNPLRDTTTATLKGDVKLFYLPNHPIAEQFIPLNRTLGAFKGLVTNYFQYIFQPKKMQEKYDLLDQLGLGFNMRRATYEDISAKENAGKILYDNPIRRLFSFRMWLGEESRTTDKWGRILELEAYMKQHKITPENMEISASRAASLTLTKGTLLNLGINESVLRGILTPEQIDIFRKTKSNEYMCIDPTKDQQDKLDELVKNDKTIATNIKNQELSLLDRAKLNRALALATTDFSRGGELTKNLNHVILFSQAATNGLVQYGEVIKRKWNNGQRADVIGMFISQLMMGYLSSAFDFTDDEQPYDDMNRGIRWKFLDKFTWTQPVQFPDQVMFMIGTHLYRSLHKVNPETSWDLIKSFSAAFNPYQSLGSPGLILDALSDRQLSKFSLKPIPGLNVWDEIRNVPPEQRITRNTGRFAMFVAKYTGVPAAKVQYLMNNSGARFWDRIVESAVGFDSGTYMTTGQWTSTSGGFLQNIMQNTLGVDKFLYETSYEKGINKLAEEAIKKVVKSANNMSDEEINNAKYAKISQDILKEYTKMYYIARDPEIQAEIRREKATVARNLFEMLLSKDIISEDLLQGYLESKSQETKDMKALYKELDESDSYVPIKSGIRKILDATSNEANASENLTNMNRSLLVSRSESGKIDTPVNTVETINGTTFLGPYHLQLNTAKELLPIYFKDHFSEYIIEDEDGNPTWDTSMFPLNILGAPVNADINGINNPYVQKNNPNKELKFDTVNFKFRDVQNTSFINKDKFIENWKNNITTEDYEELMTKMFRDRVDPIVSSSANANQKYILSELIFSNLIHNGRSFNFNNINNSQSYDTQLNSLVDTQAKLYPDEKRRVARDYVVNKILLELPNLNNMTQYDIASKYNELLLKFDKLDNNKSSLLFNKSDKGYTFKPISEIKVNYDELKKEINK